MKSQAIRNLEQKLKDALSKKKEADEELKELYVGLHTVIAEAAKERAKIISERMRNDDRFTHLTRKFLDEGIDEGILGEDGDAVPKKVEKLSIMSAVMSVVSSESDPDVEETWNAIRDKLREGGFDEERVMDNLEKFNGALQEELTCDLFPRCRDVDISEITDNVNRRVRERREREMDQEDDDLWRERAQKVEDLVGANKSEEEIKTKAAGLVAFFKGGATPWSDQELTRTGVMLWKKTYKDGSDDAKVKLVAEELTRDTLVESGQKSLYVLLARFCAKWAVHAFQRVTTGHTYAAALMCSDAQKDALTDLEMQWNAFMVCVPNGLLKYAEGCEYNRILVASWDGDAAMILLNQSEAPSRNKIVVFSAKDVAELLDVTAALDVVNAARDDLAEKEQARLVRTCVMARRLVAGLLLSLQNRDNFKTKEPHAHSGRKNRDPDTDPGHRVVFVGKPLKIDCRDHVKDFIERGKHGKKAGPPSMQFLVRGHYRRQVVGVGRSGRKVIWIEPFWKGPEDAPILTRPKEVN